MRWLLKKALLISDNVITVSNRAKEFLSEKYSIPGGKITTIPNPFDPDRFNPSKKTNHRHNGTMVHLGGLNYWQNPERFGNTTELYLNHLPDTLVRIYSYHNGSNVLKFVSRKNRSRIIVESLSSEKVPYYLQKTSFAIIFRNDGSNDLVKTVYAPIKFAEYIACGLQVIVQDKIGDISEIGKRERIGLVFNPERDFIESMQSKMDKMIHEEGETLRNICRNVAIKYFSLSNASGYNRKSIFNKPNSISLHTYSL